PHAAKATAAMTPTAPQRVVRVFRVMYPSPMSPCRDVRRPLTSVAQAARDCSPHSGIRKKNVGILRKAKTSTTATRPHQVTLDAIDRRVVAALQAEGRRAFRAIADELGISESVVRYRVQRLEKAGILQVVGIADPLKIGFDLMAMVGVNVRPGAVHDVCAGLKALPETSYVAAIAGRYDVLVE